VADDFKAPISGLWLDAHGSLSTNSGYSLKFDSVASAFACGNAFYNDDITTISSAPFSTNWGVLAMLTAYCTIFALNNPDNKGLVSVNIFDADAGADGFCPAAKRYEYEANADA
jgi:hypothetical protein